MHSVSVLCVSEVRSDSMPYTSGTESLSACAVAASRVTDLLAYGEIAARRRGAARLVLNARENMLIDVKLESWRERRK